MQTAASATVVPGTLRWRSAAAAIASISVVGIAIGLGMPLLSIILEQRDMPRA